MRRERSSRKTATLKLEYYHSLRTPLRQCQLQYSTFIRYRNRRRPSTFHTYAPTSLPPPYPYPRLVFMVYSSGASTPPNHPTPSFVVVLQLKPDSEVTWP